MRILITGGSGFFGKALTEKLLANGHLVYSLSRHPPAPAENLIPLEGDILLPNLGLENVPQDIDAVIHAAALLSFKPGDKDRLYETNWHGTENVVQWMKKSGIFRLYHISTAYLFGQNHYEISKKLAEEALAGTVSEIKTTIIRPSIIVVDSKVEGLPPLSGFYLGIAAIDRAKRYFERKTGAPPLRVKIRIRASKSNSLNLIPVNKVAEFIVEAVEADREGILYATHPTPVPLKTLEKPLSDAIGVDISFAENFEPNILERLVSLLTKGLTPYLLGEYNFPSDINYLPLTEEFLTKTIEAFLKISR